jgi:hypothetical protein
MRKLIGLVLLTAACSKSSGDSQGNSAPKEGAQRELLGIPPEKWTCDVLTSVAEIGQVLGGDAQTTEPQMKAAKGTPESCNYRVTTGMTTPAGDAGAEPIAESWMYDLDCREGYEKQAEILFAQYTQQSADLVAAYRTGVGSGKPPANDAGVVYKAPEDAFGVAVGRKALDHHGQGLIFLDENAPCYVRVVGPDAGKRLALAQLLSSKLSEKNAPMPVHGTPIMK